MGELPSTSGCVESPAAHENLFSLQQPRLVAQAGDVIVDGDARGGGGDGDGGGSGGPQESKEEGEAARTGQAGGHSGPLQEESATAQSLIAGE